jgi:hypothetical protein
MEWVTRLDVERTAFKKPVLRQQGERCRIQGAEKSLPKAIW